MFGKLNKNFGFSLIPIALLFLFEPSYSILDPLPDFIGYALLCYAVSNLADINPNIREAFVGFRNAALLNILKFLSMYVLNMIFFDAEQVVGVLLFVFVFSLFEIIILLPAYKKFFDGLLHLGIFNGGTALHHKDEKKFKKYDTDNKRYVEIIKTSKRNTTEKALILTYIFVIIRAIMAVLPELTSLSISGRYEFIFTLRALSIIVVLPIGLLWIRQIFKLCKAVSKDKPFIESLSAKFENHAKENPQFYTVRVIVTGLSVLCAAFMLSIDIYSDGLNYLPDYLFHCIMLFAIIFLSKYSKKWILPSITVLLSIPISILHHILEKNFVINFDFSLISKDIDAYYAYYNILYVRITEAILFILTVVFMVIFLWDIYKAHSETSRLEMKNEVKYAKKAYISRSTLFIVSGILSSASGVFYVISQPFYYDAWYYSYSSIISTLFQLIFIFISIEYAGFIGNSVKYRYRMDL